MTGMRTLDALDRQIISLLNDDGRLSSAAIARQIGTVTSRTVANRMKHLVDQGIVAIRAVVDPAALGYQVLADVLIETEPGRLKAVAHGIAQFDQVTYVAFATGDRDVSIQVVARNNEDLFNFVAEVLGNLPGVRRTQTHLLPAKIKDVDTWLPPAHGDESLEAPT